MDPSVREYYLNERANQKGSGGDSPDDGSHCPPPPDNLNGGYVDFNITGGPWYVGTAGIQVYDYGVYPYAGGGFGLPGVSGSATKAPNQSPSPGLNVGFQGTVLGAINFGRAFGKCATFFSEEGGGYPLGVSLTGYYVVDLNVFVRAYHESVPYPLYMPAGALHINYK